MNIYSRVCLKPAPASLVTQSIQILSVVIVCMDTAVYLPEMMLFVFVSLSMRSWKLSARVLKKA